MVVNRRLDDIRAAMFDHPSKYTAFPELPSGAAGVQFAAELRVLSSTPVQYSADEDAAETSWMIGVPSVR